MPKRVTEEDLLAGVGGKGAFSTFVSMRAQRDSPFGHELSGGKPLATAGGAVGGVLLGEGFFALKTRNEKNAYTQGFQKGRSDGVKQLYWNLQADQRNLGLPEIDLFIPEHREKGVLLNQSKRVIRLQE